MELKREHGKVKALFQFFNLFLMLCKISSQRISHDFHYSAKIRRESVRCVDFNVSGELGFDTKFEDAIEDRRPWSPRGKESEEPESRELSLDSKKPENETGQCLYELPKDKHVNTLLSHMMNVLTKMFMRTLKLSEPRAQSRARARKTRFRVVSDKGSSHFDEIYSNMTQEFRSFYRRAETSASASERSSEPCSRRRRLWRALLRRSRAELRRAAARLIHRQLQLAPQEREARLRRRLVRALRLELRGWRSRQLDWVCRRRRRCRDELA